MIENTHILDLLPAYALGSLDKAEARLVAEHLAGCHLCRAELDAYQNVANQLAFAAPDNIPLQNLKERLIERIKGLEPTQPQPERRPARRFVPLGGMIGGLLILALVISNLVLWQRLNHLEVLSGPLGMRAIVLQNTASAPQASGFVIMSADGQDGVLVVDELPSLDAQHEYQVWLERNGDHTSSGVFGVDDHGYRGMRIDAPQTLLDYSSVRVTVEPAGGSENPTGDTVLDGSLFNP